MANRLRAIQGAPTTPLSEKVAALFAAPGGTPGDFWGSAGDLTTLFQDDAMAVPVTAPGQPVRKVVDKSGRGNILTLTNCTLRQGISGAYYFYFNGNNAHGQIASLNLSSTNKVAVWVGYEATTTAASFVLEHSADSSTTAGSFGIANGISVAGAAAPGQVQAQTFGSARIRQAGTGTVARNVISTIYDLSAGSNLSAISHNVNGTIAPVGTGTVPGNVNMANTTFNVAARAAVALRFAGGISEILVLGRVPTTQERSIGVNYVSSKTASAGILFAPGTVVDILVVTGQSNAEGRGDSSLSPKVVPGAGAFWAGTGGVQFLADPVGGALTGSAWPAFVNAYFAATGRGIVIVEQATGGSGLLAGVGAADWSPSGALRAAAVAAANAARAGLASLSNITVGKTMLYWQQGEQEATTYNGTTISAATYQPAQEALFAYFFANITGLTQILVSELGESVPPDSNFALIRVAQNAAVVATTNAYLAFTGAKNFPAQGKMTDSLHYNQTGLNELGAAVATYAGALP